MNLNSICSSCRHEVNCTFINHSADSIIMCEEFELESVAKKIIKESKVLESTNGYSGLCKNCENREICTLRNSECVIWHCEEYAV
ncbi:MAG: hypothetical protein GQ527_00385 [Bacteroidales bacterium]|nr:hypothetical protein [Bacteroidales bacterium]